MSLSISSNGLQTQLSDQITSQSNHEKTKISRVKATKLKIPYFYGIIFFQANKYC